MKIWMHTLIQVLSFVVTMAMMLTNIVPAKFKPYLVGLVSAIQGFLAWYNHQFNPDGTKATIPYVENPKKP